MVEKTESVYGVMFYESPSFHFLEHKVGKTESRSKIVAKAQQSLFNKSNRTEIRSYLRLDTDRLDCKRFAHVFYQTPSFPLYGA